MTAWNGVTIQFQLLVARQDSIHLGPDYLKIRFRAVLKVEYYPRADLFQILTFTLYGQSVW